jgi:hypothetical protein
MPFSHDMQMIFFLELQLSLTAAMKIIQLGLSIFRLKFHILAGSNH